MSTVATYNGARKISGATAQSLGQILTQVEFLHAVTNVLDNGLDGVLQMVRLRNVALSKELA